MAYFETSFGPVNVFKIGLIMLLSVVHHAPMSFNGGRNRTLIGIPIPSQPDFLRLLTYRITKA